MSMRVILFRTPNLDEGAVDPYEAELRAVFRESVDIEFIPLVSFEPVDSPPLDEAFALSGEKRILVVTSVNAAQAVVVWRNCDPIRRQPILSSCVCYAVGGKAARPLEEAGFTVLGIASGNADKLAELVINDVTLSGESCSVIHPCSDFALGTFGTRCSAAGIPYHPVIVYKALFETGDVWRLLSETARNSLVERSRMVVLVFFSPGGVKTVLDGSSILRDHIAASSDCACVCATIGPTTAAALQTYGVDAENMGVAATPTPEGITQSIRDAIARRAPK